MAPCTPIGGNCHRHRRRWPKRGTLARERCRPGASHRKSGLVLDVGDSTFLAPKDLKPICKGLSRFWAQCISSFKFKSLNETASNKSTVSHHHRNNAVHFALGVPKSLLRQRLLCAARAMSALPPKADMCSALGNVRFVPKADIKAARQRRRQELGRQPGFRRALKFRAG